jgi:murein L,D-transpeptidase YcbB/YkuD
VSRRGAVALAAAWGLGACAAGPEKATPPLAMSEPETALGRLIDGAPGPVVAGERLDAAALRRFYALRGFAPVWAERRAQADALVAAVLRAEEHGLDPELFRAGLLMRRETFPALRREVLLTEAFLSYADALAHGAVPAARRKGFEALAPRRVDVAGALDAAIGSRDPVAAIQALAPATPTYRALAEAMRKHRAAPASGGRAAAERLRSIAVNLERERWLPRPLPADRVWVDVPAQQLVLFRGDRPEFSTRVVVGDNSERNQSPEFAALIEASFFNPPWVVPRDIVAAEILPRLAREPDYLARNNMVLRPNGEVEQSAGPEAGLGFVLFDMPNRFDVYLHDTPDRFLFSRSNRRMSRGCIRVQNPRELAALLLRQPVEAIDRKIAAGATSRTALPTPVPVFVTYQTAVADAGGAMQFREDFYGRDADVWRRLRARPDA